MVLRQVVLSFVVIVMSFSSAFAYSAKSYFNMSETFSSDVGPFKKWTGMNTRFDDQRELSSDQCGKVRFHPCTFEDWRNRFDGWKNKSFSEQLRVVNNFGNSHPYITDQVNWGLEDFWETPYEFHVVNGDCEDYAIAKYFSLRALGVPASQMRIIILQDLNLGGVIHAVLGVYDDNKKLYLLDNQIKRVVLASNIYHYRPIYGINEEGWWSYHPE